VCANILGAIVLRPRFKIDVVIMIICFSSFAGIGPFISVFSKYETV